MKRILVLFLFLLLITAPVFAQPGSLVLGQLIDLPTAKILGQGEVSSVLKMYPGGGLLGYISVGLTNRFFLGISWGGENIIGHGNADLNPLPCVQVGYLMLEEQNLSPGLVLGFDSQGYGSYDDDLKRYAVKSRGLYAVLSKNTSFLGGLGIHAGANWSLENDDGDNSPNLFAGCHKQINPELVVLAEYDTAVNDNNDDAIGSGKGYLNCGVRWSFAQQLFVEFSWKNILQNNSRIAGSSREVKLMYVTSF